MPIIECPKCRENTFVLGMVGGECFGVCKNCGFSVDNNNINEIGIEDSGSGLIPVTKLGLKVLELNKGGAV
jgi:hypothetical protein